MKLIHEELKNLRKSKGLTLNEVAESLGKSASFVSRIENGLQQINAEILQKLTTLYNTTLDELLLTNPTEVTYNIHREDMNFTDDFLKVLDNYLSAKEEELKEHELAEFVRGELPFSIQKAANLDKNEYKVTGSVGQGQWAEVPWISIFRKSITTSATKGYYLVYLFKADMSGFYLSLNQGWTYYKEKYGTKRGRREISKASSYLREQLNLIPKDFDLEGIDLAGKGDLSLGYEAGHICGKYYTANNLFALDSVQMLQDLNKMITVYMELVGLIGERDINQFNDYILLESDARFIEEANLTFEERVDQEIGKYYSNRLVSLFDEEIFPYHELDDKEEPEKRPDPILNKKGKQIWPRDARIAAGSLIQANYQCAYNKNHKTFISKVTRNPYMEAHHLIPMKLQKNMKYKLDKRANILCLCPSCHRLIHHGEDSERVEMLDKLFFERRSQLEQLKLEITFSDLKHAYNIEID